MFESIYSQFGDEEERARIRELQAGSEQAFDWLIAQYGQQVFRLASRILNDQADSADVAQEVFIKIFRSIGKFQGHCSLKTWMYRITVHTAVNQNRWWYRHREREFSLDAGRNGERELKYLLPASVQSPFESLMSRETQAMVWKALQRLPEAPRTVLVLREMEGLAYEEVAEILQISLGTVKSRLARARQSLKLELESLMQPAPARIPVWNPVE